MKKIYTFALLLFGTLSIAQTWETLESLPAGASERHHPVTFSIGGIGYLVAGADEVTRSLSDFYAYDPSSDTWEDKGDYPGQKEVLVMVYQAELKDMLVLGWIIIPLREKKQFYRTYGNMTQLQMNGQN